jgi:tetratricopeptide (TPR) repeat protein
LGDDTGSPLGAEIALQIAGTKILQGRLPSADSWFKTALQAARRSGTLRLFDQARAGLAGLLAAGGEVARASVAFQSVAEAHAVVGGDLVTRWMAIAGWADLLRLQGRYSEAVLMLNDAVVEARGGPSPPTYVRLLLALATCELELCRLGRAQESVDELVATIAQGEQLHLRLEARLVQGRIQLASGQLGPANYLLQEVVDQSDLAGLTVLASKGRAFLAETRWALGAQREAVALYKVALVAVADVGDHRAIVEVVTSRSRAFNGREDPERGFYLVRNLLEGEEFRPLQVEVLLARFRWNRRQGHETEAVQFLAMADEAITRLAADQHPIEQAALRVHPWAGEVRHAKTSGGQAT